MNTESAFQTRWFGLVVVATSAVCVSVCQFFGCRFAYINNFKVKVKCLPGQRVIGIYFNHKLAGFYDADLTVAVFGMNRGYHAGEPFLCTSQMFSRNALNRIGDTLAITVGWLNGNAEFITGLFACQWMIKLVRNAQLKYFSYYCFIVGTLAIGYQLLA